MAAGMRQVGGEILEKLQKLFYRTWDCIDARVSSNRLIRGVLALVVLYVVVTVGLAVWWSQEPDMADVKAQAEADAKALNQQVVSGYYTTSTLIHLTDTLLHKAGGYTTNDRFPPGLWMDNMPSWEHGVLVQVRDFSQAMRRSMSRSQSQSTEDADLVVAQPQFNFDSNSWIFPSSESAYKKALKSLEHYRTRLAGEGQRSASFYARADNLNEWLGDVSSRLGSLSQRLSASVGQRPLPMGEGSEPKVAGTEMIDNEIKTPWLKIDNVFYEARGTSWALIQLLHAIEIDFAPTLEKKEAMVSLQQIIRELESTQEPIWSPVILNGTEFGFLANHSLVMASYISRANAAIIDLRELLSNG